MGLGDRCLRFRGVLNDFWFSFFGDFRSRFFYDFRGRCFYGFWSFSDRRSRFGNIDRWGRGFHGGRGDIVRINDRINIGNLFTTD